MDQRPTSTSKKKSSLIFVIRRYHLLFNLFIVPTYNIHPLLYHGLYIPVFCKTKMLLSFVLFLIIANSLVRIRLKRISPGFSRSFGPYNIIRSTPSIKISVIISTLQKTFKNILM